VALAHDDKIDLDDLPPAIRGEYADVLLPSLTRGESMRAWGSRYARLIFERCAQNKRQACRKLGISYHTLQAYLTFEPARSAAGHHEVPEWPEEGAADLALCRVAETVDDELSSARSDPRARTEANTDSKEKTTRTNATAASHPPAVVTPQW
jgi:hypothetical protein